MGKNILVLTGSPRNGGNSDLLADAFIKGAEAAGHEVVKFKTAVKRIKGCVACDKCFSKGAACIYQDDFNELAMLLANADTLVLATPLYWYTFPAQLKAAIDKIYAFIVGNEPLKITECLLLTCGEITEESAFDGIVKSYELIAEDRGWIDRGHLIVKGVGPKGAIKNTSALKEAEKLGCGI